MSHSTGAELKQIRISFQAATDEASSLAREIIREGRTLETLDADGKVTANWKPRQLSESYSNNNPTHYYVWELVQEETLVIEQLQLAELTIVPYQYQERFDEQGRMTIEARARLDSEQLQRLRNLPLYFPVVRGGISDTPREMRFGRLLWSDHGEFVKHEIRLVDRTVDEDKRVALFEPEMTHFREGIAQSAGLLEALIDALKAKGVLDETMTQQIREQVSKSMRARLEQFDRVDDLDEWR